MLTVHEVIPRDQWSDQAADHITLDYDARHRRRWVFTADHGTTFLLDLPRAVVLQHGDGLQLSDGRVIQVLAADEDLVEVTAADVGVMMRLAWHIGNRHLPAELHPHAIRLRDDYVINAMLEGLGATVTKLKASFTPEGGAYSGDGQHAHHGHHHGHHHDDHCDDASHAHSHEHPHDHGSDAAHTPDHGHDHAHAHDHAHGLDHGHAHHAH